jgi:hypothetical protein
MKKKKERIQLIRKNASDVDGQNTLDSQATTSTKQTGKTGNKKTELGKNSNL